MRVVRAVKLGLLLACVSSIFCTGCASLSPKLRVLPSLARHRADSQYHAARQAEQRGQLEKARELYATLQRHSPNVPQYSHRMGVVCTELQDYATAGKYFEHARGLAPHDPELLADMGYCAYLQKDYTSAETLLSEAVRLAPGDSRAVNNLAMSLGYLGRYDESLAQFRRGNSESQAQVNVAFIQNQRGESTAAMATYRRVLAQDPGNKIASASLQQLHTAQQRQPNVLDQVGDQFASLAGLPSPSAAPAWEVAPLPPMIAAVPPSPPAQTTASADRDLASNTAPDVPIVIIPIDAQWTTTPAAARQHPLETAADKAFELPTRSAPPSELAEVPAQPAMLSDSTTTAATKAAIPDDIANVFEVGDAAKETPMADPGELASLDWAKEGLAHEKAAVDAGLKESPLADDFLHGFCPVALRDERRLAAAQAEFTHEHQAQTYRFSSAVARDQFIAHPDWYVPAAGGLDVIEVQRGHSVAQGSLDHACWFRHKLHMFSTAENLAAFRATPRNFAIY
jgi:Flp pilus assembly protein TadD/YHS domain-containing protein